MGLKNFVDQSISTDNFVTRFQIQERNAFRLVHSHNFDFEQSYRFSVKKTPY